MAGSKTAYLSKKLLDHGLGGATYTPPTTVFVLLSTAAFDPAAVVGSMSEVTASDYARLSVGANSTYWTAATAAAPSEKHNVSDLAWAPATSSWGTPQSVYLADASTGGNLLYGADITNPQLISSGDTPKIVAAAFVFNED